MTREELTRYDGRDGRPAYVAVGGIIYDLSSSPRWQDGSHEGLHLAGRDLTHELKSAPHVAAVVERFPSVGRLDAPGLPEAKARGVGKWLIPALIAALVVLWLLMR